VITLVPVWEGKVMLATSIPLAVSNWTFGIVAAIIFGGIMFIVKYGRQCRDTIAWIIETYRRNTYKTMDHKEKNSDIESAEDLSKEEILEIKRQISTLSQQIKALLIEIKKIRRSEILNALEGDVNTASTEYGMKFELKRSEFEETTKILQDTLERMPEQAMAYRQKTAKWIARAQKIFDKYSPENLVQKFEALKSRHKNTQDI
jgi:hypothetical protein